MNKTLRTTETAQLLLSRIIFEGQTVIDATAGKGHDTVFLAKIVGKTGRVYAFDIQKQALEETKKHLIAQDCFEQVILIHDSHENIDKYVNNRPVSAIIYNLGYLPGGNKEITTKSASTITSLKKSLDLVEPGGVLSIVAYPGHSEGAEEAREIEEYLRNLQCPPWHVLTYKRVNGAHSAPYMLIVQKEGKLKEETL